MAYGVIHGQVIHGQAPCLDQAHVTPPIVPDPHPTTPDRFGRTFPGSNRARPGRSGSGSEKPLEGRRKINRWKENDFSADVGCIGVSPTGFSANRQRHLASSGCSIRARKRICRWRRNGMQDRPAVFPIQANWLSPRFSQTKIIRRPLHTCDEFSPPTKSDSFGCR